MPSLASDRQTGSGESERVLSDVMDSCVPLRRRSSRRLTLPIIVEGDEADDDACQDFSVDRRHHRRRSCPDEQRRRRRRSRPRHHPQAVETQDLSRQAPCEAVTSDASVGKWTAGRKTRPPRRHLLAYVGRLFVFCRGTATGVRPSSESAAATEDAVSLLAPPMPHASEATSDPVQPCVVEPRDGPAAVDASAPLVDATLDDEVCSDELTGRVVPPFRSHLFRPPGGATQVAVACS